MPPEYVFAVRSAACASSNRSSRAEARRRASAEGDVVQTADHLEVLQAGQVLVHRGVLAGQADHATELRRLPYDVVPGHGGAPAVGVEQRGQDPHGGRLAGAVRSQSPSTVPCRTSTSTPSSA